MARKEKKSKRNTFLVIFIAFIMVSSVIGFLYSGETNKFKYKKMKFTRTENGWSTLINNQRLSFTYFPTEVEQIELNPEILTAISNKPEVDTTSELNDTFSEEIALAQYDMAFALNKMNIYLRQGFTTNNSFNTPIITCEGSTRAVPVIYFKQSNQTKISLENDCIIAEARNNIDILRIKDRLLYSILGIFQIE